MRLRNLFSKKTATDVADNLSHDVREHARCGQHLSGKATMIETGIQLSGYKRWLSDPTKFDEHLAAAKAARDKPFSLPPRMNLTSQMSFDTVDGATVVTVNNQGQEQPTILYLYGGALVDLPQKEHWQFCDRLAQASGARIVVPLYPLVPGHTYRDDYRLIAQLYTQLIHELPASDITVMGDSAGGLLALGFCEQLGVNGFPQPGHLVLFSPWLELDLTNPVIDKFDEKDVMLAPSGLRRIGNMWAGDENHRDYHLSPLYGNLRPLRDVRVYVGTNEVMAPDVTELDRRLTAEKVPSSVTIARGLFHTYPIYDFPEGRAVVRELAKLLKAKQ